MTRAQLLADYLGVTPANAPGLYKRPTCQTCMGHYRIHKGDEFTLPYDCPDCVNGKALEQTLTHHLPGDPDLPRDVQAAWLFAFYDHWRFIRIERLCGPMCRVTMLAGDDGDTVCFDEPTPDAACLAALLAADAEFAKKWEAAG